MATTNLTSTAGLSAKMAVYYEKMMLDRLRASLVFHKYGTKKNLPANNGKQVNWFRRVDRGANVTPITEGTVPSPVTLSSNSVTAQLAQYGDFTQTSDLIQMTSIDDEIEAAVDILSWSAAQTLDTLDRNILDGGTNIAYGGGKASLAATAAADVLTGADVRKGVRLVKAVNAEPLTDDKKYVWIVHPNNSYDLQSDTAAGGWQQANTYVDNSGMRDQFIGTLYGASFSETTQVSFTASGTSGGANVYSTHLIAKGAFGVVEFDGGIHVYVKKSGDQDTSNPLNQYATVGYKLTYTNKMLDDLRQVTYKVGSAF